MSGPVPSGPSSRLVGDAVQAGGHGGRDGQVGVGRGVAAAQLDALVVGDAHVVGPVVPAVRRQRGRPGGPARARGDAAGALVGVHRRRDDRLQRGGVLEDPGHEGVRRGREPQPDFVLSVPGLAGEQRAVGRHVAQREVQVQPRAGPVRERLGHEGRDHAALVGQHVEQVAQRDDPVGGGERVGVLEVLLELPVAVLVVVGVVAPAQRVHGRADRRQVVVHPGHAAGVVARLVRVVGGVRRHQAPAGVPLEQEVLDLGPGVRREPGGRRLLDHRTQDHPRRERPRLPQHVRVAVDQREPLLDERDRRERRDVRDRHQVGVLGLLPHRPHGVPREPDALGGELLDRLDRHELGARLPGEVDEQREDELRAVLVGQGGQLARLHRDDSFIYCGESTSTDSRQRTLQGPAPGVTARSHLVTSRAGRCVRMAPTGYRTYRPPQWPPHGPPAGPVHEETPCPPRRRRTTSRSRA